MFFDILIYMQIMGIIFMLMMFVYKYMLILLTLVEFLVISISLIMYMYFSFMGMEFYLIYYLVFSVCESVLGLSLLVMVVRFYGSDLYYMFNISKF
uniref:NADH dehydrogenase subunit 4L n=1 Tax=Crematogaster teranishii TaxID=2586727 RepID=A0A7L8Y486_9HYME|nr:NADH dehydrogenase subunit 4L [Crematogaster teranishii]QOI14044.1 NADH dehydrogenase subunit 4L [Crematogaster teranishii]